MSKEEKGKTKQARQLAKSSSSQPAKRTHSDVSPNRSMEEMTAISHQMEDLTDDIKSIKNDLKQIMTKDQMQSFIKDAVSSIISDFNENIDLLVELKVEEKTKAIRERMRAVEEENKQLRADIMSLRSDMKINMSKINESVARSKAAETKANYNEQYSRRNNIKFMNVKEQDEESEENLKSKICALVSKNGVNLDPSKVIAIHRIPGKPGFPKPVLVKLSNNNEKTKIMKRRKEFKNMGNRLVDDVTKLNADLIKSLLDHQNIDQAWYFNGHVYGKSQMGRRFKFDIHDDIDRILRS